MPTFLSPNRPARTRRTGRTERAERAERPAHAGRTARTVCATPPVAVTAAMTAPVAAAQFAPAQPLIPGSPMQDPVVNMTEPNWSGLDVREASALTGDLELPDTAGTAVKEVPLDTPMHMPDAALNQRFLYSTVD